MLLLIILLIFVATILLFQALCPIVLKSTEQWYRRRVEKLTPKLDRIWLDVPENKLLIVNIFLPVALGLIGLFVFKGILGAVIGIFVGLAIPFIIIKNMERQRLRKFSSQLVDGIMLLSGSLKAGLSLMQALEVLVEEMPPPISQELGLVLRENKMGVSLEKSLEVLNKRMKIEELELLINALLVARETGGDLTKLLSRLAITIRDRHKIKEKIKTLTLQGKMQGVIMSALPFLFALWIHIFVNKHHFDIMLQTDQGRFLLILAVVLQIVGMYLIHKFSIIKT